MVVAELFAQLGLDVDASAFDAAEKALAALRGGAAAVGAAVAAVAAGMVAAAGSAAAFAGEIDDLHQRTGIAHQTLQEFMFAAEQSGASLDTVVAAFRTLGKNALAASEGNKDLSARFRQLGVSVNDASGKLKPADVLMDELALALADVEDVTKRNAIAFDLFGKSGAELGPLMKRGEGGIAALRAEARQLGYIMEDDMLKAGDALGDNMNKLKFIFLGIRNVIGGPLMKALASITDRFIAWYKVNGAMVRQRVAVVFERLTDALRLVWRVVKPLGRVLLALGGALAFVAEHFKTLAAIALVLLAPSLIAMVPALTALAFHYAMAGGAALLAGLEAAAAWVAATWPLLALLAGLALVILVVEDLWTAFHGGESFIVAVGRKWTAFLDSFLKPQAGDHWLLATIKQMASLLFDFQGQWPRLVAQAKEGFRIMLDTLLSLAKEFGPSIIGALFPGGGALLSLGQRAVEGARGLFGGGATGPAASVAASPGGGVPPLLAPTFRASFTINTQPGQDGEAAAGATRDTLAEWWDGVLSPVTPALGGT